MRAFVLSLCILTASVAMLLLGQGNQELLKLVWISSSAIAAVELRQLRSHTGWKGSALAAAVGPSIVFAPIIIHYIFVIRPLPESLQELFSRFVELIYFAFCGSLVFGTFGGTIGVIWYFLRKTAERQCPSVAATPGNHPRP